MKRKPTIVAHSEPQFSEMQKKYLEEVIRDQVEEVEEKLGGSIKALQIQLVRQFVEHEAMVRQLFEERQKQNETHLKVIEELRQENYELRKRLTKP